MVERTVAGSVYIGSSVSDLRNSDITAARSRAAPTPGIGPNGDVDDPWAWMRDLDDPELLAYLTAENAYARSLVRATTPRPWTRCSRRSARGSRRPTCRCPCAPGDWWYVTSTVEGSSYPIHHRGPHHRRKRPPRSCSTRTSKRTATSTSTSVPSTCHTTTRWPHGRSTPRATSGTRSTFATSPRASTCPTRSPTCRTPASPGRATARGCSTSPPTTRNARTGCGATLSTADPLTGETAPATTCSCSRRATSATSSGVGETRSDDFVVIQSSSKTSSEMRLIPTDDPTADPVVVRPAPGRHRVQHRSLGRRAHHAHQRRRHRLPHPGRADRRRLDRRVGVDRTRAPRRRSADHGRRPVRRTTS